MPRLASIVARPLVATLARLAALATVAAAAIVPLAPAPAAQAALPANPVVDNRTRTGALNAYKAYHQAAQATAASWVGGSTATCAPGSVGADAQAATLTTLNYYRAMVGLKPVAFSSTMNANAQRAALMMDANNALSHNPPTTWKCYTTAGAAAAKTGNLYLTTGTATGPRAIKGYIADSGNDATLGHRRWLLNPSLLTMGNGTTARANAIQLWSGTLPTANPTGTPAYVSWPDAGYVPTALVPANNIWTVSASNASTDMSAATVTVKSGSTVIPVTVTRPSVGYGRPAVGFKPSVSYGSITSDRPLTITVSNIKRGGVVQPSYTYTTTLFNAAYSRSPQSISWTAPTVAYPAQSSTLSARSTSGLPASFSSTTPTTCTVTGTTVSYLAPGNCGIKATQAGNTTWAPTSTTRTVLVWSRAKATNYISWTSPTSGTVGTSTYLTAKASSGLAVSYASHTPSVCTVSGTKVTHVGGGSCSITASQAGSATVNPAVAVRRTWTVTGLKANPITWNVVTSQRVGGYVLMNPTSASGSSSFSYSASMSAHGVCTFGSGRITFGAKGTCTVTVTQPATTTHQAGKVTKVFTVS